MKKTLADLFMKSGGRPVEYEGLTVHGAAFKQVRKPGVFVVRFVKAVASPLQALRIHIDPGILLVEDSESPRVILRLDTCPDVVKVLYRPGPVDSRITFYNAWMDEDGEFDSWLVHAGMLVEERGNKMLLRCSDSQGEPTFADLVVEIEFLDE